MLRNLEYLTVLSNIVAFVINDVLHFVCISTWNILSLSCIVYLSFLCNCVLGC